MLKITRSMFTKILVCSCYFFAWFWYHSDADLMKLMVMKAVLSLTFGFCKSLCKTGIAFSLNVLPIAFWLFIFYFIDLPPLFPSFYLLWTQLAFIFLVSEGTCLGNWFQTLLIFLTKVFKILIFSALIIQFKVFSIPYDFSSDPQVL